MLAADITLPCTMRPAVNHGERRGGAPVDMLVLHYTGMPDEEGALRWLTCRESGVSCHYFVHEDGRIAQLVPEALRAWHAGISHWRGHDDINSRSIGVEIANPGHEHGYRPFAEPQMQSVIALCADIAARHAIAPRNLVAHSDIAPGRKRDPGELFDWPMLHEHGLGHWVAPAPIDTAAGPEPDLSGGTLKLLQEKLAAYGYGIVLCGEYDRSTREALVAFQRHFRPARVDGVADTSTIVTLERLLAALPAL
jgi:N-acetylmuramoyl-L-alanine amidase